MTKKAEEVALTRGYLGMVEDRFGPETVAHLKQMTSYRLERDLLTGKLQLSSLTLPRGDNCELVTVEERITALP